jgi:FKBP-type peptidyl-prolyl cis-trans isomerase FkpA
MNKSTYALMGLLLLSAACSKPEKETPSGLKYTVIEAGDGVLPKKDEVLVFDYQLKDSKDSVWGETFKEGIPAATKIEDSTHIAAEDGMSQMFRMLATGDSVKVTMPVKDFFSKVVRSPAPPHVDTTSSLTYTIKVRDVMSVEEYLKAREAQMKKRELRVFKNDAAEIGKYLSENAIKAKVDTSGLQYIVHTEKGGKKPTLDNCVEVRYSGRFLKTGAEFDKNDRIAFPLSGVITGWKLAIPMLGVGDSATFYIPSKLAYGPQGYPGAIPPDAILIFNVKLLAVKDQFDQATRTCK